MPEPTAADRQGDAYVQLSLTCADRTEADTIAQAFLEQKLIACAKFVPVESSFWWQGKITHGTEVMLLMESQAKYFTIIEAEVARLHSYETFVLTAIPLHSISKQATTWLEETFHG